MVVTLVTLSSYIWNSSKKTTVSLIVFASFALGLFLMLISYKHKTDLLRSLVNSIAEQTINKLNSGDWIEVLDNVRRWQGEGYLSYLEVYHQDEVLIGPIISKEHYFKTCSEVISQEIRILACAPVLLQEEVIVYLLILVAFSLVLNFIIRSIQKKILDSINTQMEHLANLTVLDVQELDAYRSGIFELIQVQQNFKKLTDEIGRNNRAIEKWSSTRRFAHDIRHLLDLASRDDDQHELEEKPFQAIAKIQEMARSYLGENLSEKMFFEPSRLFHEWKTEALQCYPNIEVVVECPKNSSFVYFPVYEMKSILWNSLKNSREAIGVANRLRFSVRMDIQPTGVLIAITDNAKCSLEVIERFNSRNFFTSKPLGYGIGVRSLVDVVQRYDGKVTFSQREGALNIEVLLSGLAVKGNDGYQIIHVEDDKYVCAGWIKAFSNVGVDVLTSNDGSVADRLSTKGRYIAFIDIELGQDLKGFEVANLLSRKGVKHIYLSTNYTGSDISIPGCVMGVIGKEAPV